MYTRSTLYGVTFMCTLHIYVPQLSQKPIFRRIALILPPGSIKQQIFPEWQWSIIRNMYVLLHSPATHRGIPTSPKLLWLYRIVTISIPVTRMVRRPEGNTGKWPGGGDVTRTYSGFLKHAHNTKRYAVRTECRILKYSIWCYKK